MFSSCGYNVRIHFLVISLDLNLTTLWDKFCLKWEPQYPGSNFISFPENLGNSGYQQHMRMPIKLSINYTHLRWTTLADRQLVNELALQRMGVFSWFINENRHRKSSPKNRGLSPWPPNILHRNWIYHLLYFLYIFILEFQLCLLYFRLEKGRCKVKIVFTLGMSSGFCAQPIGACASEKRPGGQGRTSEL